jgi:pyruvate kinase
MKLRTVKLQSISEMVTEIICKSEEMELRYSEEIKLVHPLYFKSAQNLIHYLAFRSFDIDKLQDRLREFGLPSLTHIEGHVMESLLSIKTIINHLLGKQKIEHKKGVISLLNSKKIRAKNTRLLFGFKSKFRATRIMVTLPESAVEDPKFMLRLLRAGMNVARVNCAHGDPAIWKQLINCLEAAQKTLNKQCKIMMDLGGPKLRTGPIAEGPKVIHISPQRNAFGRVVTPARVWIAPLDIPPPDDTADAVLPIDEVLMRKIKRKSTIFFDDSRGKKCKITIFRKEGPGKWGLCKDSAYIESGTKMEVRRHKKSGKEEIYVGELMPLEQFLVLKKNDTLMLTKHADQGQNAFYGAGGALIKPASVSCTLPEVFAYVKKGEPVFFDDGKIEGVIQEVHDDYLNIRITHAKEQGSKLRADKGINLPESDLSFGGLTSKDKEDMNFIINHADAVNFSFVNNPDDVRELQQLIEELHGTIGIILKVETQKAFKNLPRILLRAMQTYPVGVMIARGDLAIETGWKNFASIQEEILRICEAAHIPDIWATQVLESMTKKGIPTRAEITDASMAQRAECVMLNKGVYIEKAVKLLDKILTRMQRYQKKQQTILPKLSDAEELKLDYY